MIVVRRIRETERGFLFRNREFVAVLGPGWHVAFSVARERIEVVSVRDAWIRHPDLDVIARSGKLGEEAVVLDLADHERALVWIDGRFEAVVKPGLSALWTVFRKVAVERIDASAVKFDHAKLASILASATASAALESATVEAGHAGIWFREGRVESVLSPGTHAFWKGIARMKLSDVDLREQVADVSGQEIVTADKVTLRINAVVTFRVADPVKALTSVEDFRQALYREAQLALRAVVGTKELDALLAEKDQVASELDAIVRRNVAAFGVQVVSLGIRDIILPGEMKELLNRVTEAKKAAEAALITRREETAAMRSQANTARIFEGNPTLMRLRELEALEKVARSAKLSVVLGDRGLADTVVKLV